MLCDVCRKGLQGIWDPRTRIGPLQDFPEVMGIRFRVEDDEFDRILSESELKEPERYVFGHHVDYDSLIRSKQQGCVACKEFGVGNDDDDVNKNFAELGYYSVFCIDLSQSQYDWPMMLVYVGDPIEEIFHDLVLHNENDYINSMISSSTSQGRTWVLIQSWLDRCIKSHILCHNHALAGFVPTRLLELLTIGSEKAFRLVYKPEFDLGERYVTLSHCWGPEPAWMKLQLLTSVEHILHDGLPVNILPRTFRDAFEIAERLHVRYIWIDRLCIIQDSVDDWQKESATMQTVYRNGFLNIAALGAKDDEDGCFFDRIPAQTAPTIINLNSPQEIPLHYRHVNETQSWVRDFKNEPLITRAWVLQERMLATRTLYFGKKQVFWECCTTTCCETIPAGPLLTEMSQNTAGLDATSSKSGRFAWKKLIDATSTSSSLREGTDYLNNLLSEWSAAVRAYCECSLTFPKDKLVALSGLARDMGTILRNIDPTYDSYHAGMWMLTMPDSLLWKVKGPNNRPSPYRAPSWSWASVDGPLILPAGGGKSRNLLVEVLSVDTFFQDDEVAGKVSRGRLLLKGPMCLAKGLRPLNLSSPLINTCRIESLQHLDTGLPIDVHLASAKVEFDDSNDQYDEVFTLPFWSYSLSELYRVITRGLAFVPVDGNPNFYRRVGYAQLDVDVEMDASIEEQTLDNHNPVLNACQIRTIEAI